MKGSDGPTRIAWCLLLLATAACAGLDRRAVGCPVTPVSSRALPEGSRLHSRIQMWSDVEEFRFDAIASVEDGVLTVVGIAPFGLRLFAIRQEGRGYRIDDGSLVGLAPPPDWVMDVLHRTYWILPPASVMGEQPVRWERHAEQVADWIDQGRLRRRVYTRTGREVGKTQRGGVYIDYHASHSGEGSAESVVRNPWCGYESRLVTLERSPSYPGASGDAVPNSLGRGSRLADDG